MQRPTGGLKQWASDARATVEEPSDAFIKKGFTTAKPRVGIFNWLFKRLFEWVDYLDQSTSTDSFLYHEHSTSRPRLEIPLELPASNKLAGIEVLKRTEASVGGVSGTSYSGSGAVSASVASRSLSYVAGQTKAAFNSRPGQVAMSYAYSGLALPTPLRQGTPIAPSPSILLNVVSYGMFVYVRQVSNTDPLRLDAIEVVVSSGNLYQLIWPGHFIDTGGFSTTNTRTLNNIIDYEQPYLILAQNLTEITKGNCVIWRLNRTNNPSVRTRIVNIAPVYKNVTISGNLTYLKPVQSYTLTTETGSMLGTQIALNNSSPFNQETYTYDPATDTIKIKLSGTVTATAFHTLNIIKDGTTVLSLLASNATYDATEKTFTWSSITTDPLSAGGTTTFNYATSGTGLPAYNFVVVTSGLRMEIYNNKDYLNILPASGVSNGDTVLIKQKETT